MASRKRLWLVALGVLALVAAGCGGGSGGYGGSGGSAATSTPGSGSGAVVSTATATVGGKSETILTDSSGKTLYYFDPDSSAQSACTGGCASTWPPLIATSGSVQAPAGVPSYFSVVSTGNGNQVEFYGHPLYTYSGDSGPGQTNGDGIQGKWHVATPSTPSNTNGGGAGY